MLHSKMMKNLYLVVTFFLFAFSSSSLVANYDYTNVCALASNSSNQAISVWLEVERGTGGNPDTYRVRYSTSTTLGVWSAPATLSTSNYKIYTPTAVMSEMGDIVVAWIEVNPSNLYNGQAVSVGSLISGLSTPQIISTTNEQVYLGSTLISLGTGGSVFVIWNSILNQTKLIRTSYANLNQNVWSTPTSISAS